MASWRIKVHQYREVLYRIRHGETIRAIDRAEHESFLTRVMEQPKIWILAEECDLGV